MDKIATKENKGRIVEWLIFGFYAIMLIVISSFHEPWYDEAEAWQIAKAPLKDILFYIPHYEGHPALWYLILAIPVRLGVPFEWGLKSIAVGSALVYGWLLLFKSPFPKILRYTLPFHYFLFFQFGVVSRPYCLMAVFFFLMAMAFPKRNEKPWPFVLFMAVQCALSGYGIVLCGGICIAWVWEICQEKQWKLISADFWKDRRVHALLTLLVITAVIILEIMPRSDTYATGSEATNSLAFRLIYTMFMMLADSTVITVLEGAAFLNKAQIAIGIIVVGVVIGICLLLGIIALASKKNLKYYFIPYILFTVFCAFVYFCSHHIGMIFVFTVFWLWICFDEPERLWLWKRLSEKVKISDHDRKTLGFAGKALLAVLILIPIYWTIGASYLDVKGPFYYGRNMAKFFQEHELDKLFVMSEFDEHLPALFHYGDDMMEYVNTELVSRPIALLAYYDHNFCANLNMGRDDAAYALHRTPSAEENLATIKAWREMGRPDVIIGDRGMFLVLGDDVLEEEYARVYEFKSFMDIWKAFTCKHNISYRGYVYLRRDLLEQYGLTEIEALNIN